jgi:hypothetical protein
MSDPSSSVPYGGESDRLIDRYQMLFDADPGSIEEFALQTFTIAARLDSDTLATPLVGRGPIIDYLRSAATEPHRPATRRITAVEWAHSTARWCWAAQGPTGTRRGMDIVRLEASGQLIELVVRFSGLLPPPT